MIIVPASAWTAVTEAFTRPQGLAERVAFLDGVAGGHEPSDGGVVTTVTLPQAHERDASWEVETHEMRRAGVHLRLYGLVRLAQVHAHPGTWVGHSATDDERAFSQRPGTVSIVLPGYALTCPGLGDAGVHVRERNGWRELPWAEVAAHVRVVPSVRRLPARTMTSISDRHEGDLGGSLTPWDRRRRLRVQVCFGNSAAHAAVQHAGWMLVNLLARMDGVVTAVHLRAPDVPLLARVMPLAAAGASLLDALGAGGERIGVVPVTHDNGNAADVVFELGPGPAHAGCIRVHGDGWAGGISAGAALVAGRWSTLPFGPYAAACLAAGRVFLLSRAPELASEDDLTAPLIWSTWTVCAGGDELFSEGPAMIHAVLDAGLAGAGAVGTAAMQAAWAAPGVGGKCLVVDSDRRGVDETNLNRGVLFLRTSVGRPKAPEAVAQLAGGELAFEPRSGRYEDQGERPGLLLSAVDRRRARDAIQGQYPARAIGASTHGLRAELLRTGPAGRGACLRCFNVPEAADSDEALRARVRDAAPDQLAAVAARAGISIQDARKWAVEGGCGAVDGAMLRTLGIQDDDHGAGEFAVAFVSAFAGTLLAAEAIKETLGAPAGLGDAANRASVQFLRPRAVRGPAPFARDPHCPACRPGPAREIWARRRADWGPARP